MQCEKQIGDKFVPQVWNFALVRGTLHGRDEDRRYAEPMEIFLNLTSERQQQFS